MRNLFVVLAVVLAFIFCAVAAVSDAAGIERYSYSCHPRLEVLNGVKVVRFDIVNVVGDSGRKWIYLPLSNARFLVYSVKGNNADFRIFTESGMVGPFIYSLSLDQMRAFEDRGLKIDWPGGDMNRPMRLANFKLNEADLTFGFIAYDGNQEIEHSEYKMKDWSFVVVRRVADRKYLVVLRRKIEPLEAARFGEWTYVLTPEELQNISRISPLMAVNWNMMAGK